MTTRQTIEEEGTLTFVEINLYVYTRVCSHTNTQTPKREDSSIESDE